MRGEDFSIWTLIETELQNRRLPTEEPLSDFLTWSCGMALVIPGFFSDLLALALLIPIIKEELIRLLRKKCSRKFIPEIQPNTVIGLISMFLFLNSIYSFYQSICDN